MSRKHFIAIAAAILENRKSTSSKADRDVVDMMANAIADVCAGTNGQFDRSRFLRACGI